MKGSIKRQGVDKQAAFLEYKKSDEGALLENSIKDNRSELKGLKTNVKEMTDKCNEYKKNIDAVKFELDKKQDERRENQKMQNLDDDELDEEGPQEIIDEDELSLLQRMKELKKNYRSYFNDLKGAKGQITGI